MEENIIVFEVLEVNGYELRVKIKETFGGLEIKPKIVKMHYLNLIKDLQDAISQKENIIELEGIERGDEILELLYQRRDLTRKIEDVAFELLTNADDEKK